MRTKVNFLIVFIGFLVSIPLVYAANWTREMGGYYHIPQFIQLKNDDLTNFKVRITDKNPYTTTGIFLKSGQLDLNNNHVIAKTNNNIPVKIQFDAQNFYANGTVRFALVTVEKPTNTDDEFEIILSKSTVVPFGQKIKPLKPVFTVTINHPQYGQKTVQSVTAKSETKPWRSGHLIDVRRYYAPVSPDFMVEFDVTTFANGMVAADIVMRYDRLYKTPMTSLNYSATILYNNKPYKELKNIKQNHHSKFRIPVKFGFKSDNIIALNIPHLINTGALARYDVTFGIDPASIEKDYNDLQTANNTINGSSLVNMAMPTTGARPEIALLPEWTVRYLLTSHDMARKVMLKQGDIAAYAPWHFIDEKTNEAPLPNNHTKLWFDERATIDNNGIAPYNTQDTGWFLDIAHQPSLSYIPYVITGDRYYYDNLVAAYTWSRFNVINENYGILRDPTLRTQNFEQVRSYGWNQRVTAELALVTPTSSPLSQHLTKQIDADIVYFQKGQMDGLEFDNGKYGNPNGELSGALFGYGGDTGRENPLFMQNLAAIGIGFHAYSGVNPAMKTISSQQVNFISGIFLQKNNGFPPEYGTAYKFMQFVDDEQNGISTLIGKKKIVNRWRDVFTYSVDSGYFKDTIKDVKSGHLSGYEWSANLFVGYSRAAQAMLFNVTKDPKSLEAYGFLAQYLPKALKDYHVNPAYMIIPELNGGYITYNNIQIGDDADDNLIAEANYSLLHGNLGNDNLLLEQFSGVAFGGDGNDFLTAGKQNSYLFGGSGQDTLISDKGNDYLKGDEDYGRDKDVFIFTQENFGSDVIADFTPDIDKIKFTADTGIRAYYHDSKLYGTTSDKKDNKKTYRQTINPDFTEFPKGSELTPEQKIALRRKIEGLLSQEARGDKQAAKQLNIQSTVNVGIQNYMRPDGNGGTYIDLNINRTLEEKEVMKNTDKKFGVIHLIGVPITKIKSSDFIFSKE